jgi:uncharacterized lipoprotein YddW (UPF0748 family)
MRWLCLVSCLTAAAADIPAPPTPLREFRGAWVATVRGVDFPFEAGAPAVKQQAELRALIEKAAVLRLNALIFQVRPMGDAFYKSSIEPWSPWLTGQMGKAPDIDWDPLEFAIKEAHARGIELHAWFNPFRALNGSKYSAEGSHMLKQHPECCWSYGSDVWMDPGEEIVRDRAKAVILDVVRRYDVDGIHIDDYFYPYPEKRNGAWREFPDDRAWKKYVDRGGKLDRKAWRRENVDTLVRDIYADIKGEKPWVRFGISPFGLWRPGFPEGTGKGALDPFDAIGADSLKWLQNGWCDYLAPQLYWPIKPENLSFTTIFDWWLKQNTSHRHIWPGMASQRVLQDRQPYEILREISVTRERGEFMPPGHIHWNVSALLKNQGTLADLVGKRAYQQFAMPPSASWLGNEVPVKPEVTVKGGRAEWKLFDPRFENTMKWWLVQSYENGAWQNARLMPVSEKAAVLPKGSHAVSLRGISLTGLASEAALAVFR